MAYVVPLPIGGVSVTTNLEQYVQNCTAAGNPLFTATVTVAPGYGQPPYQFNLNGGAYVAGSVNSRTHVFTGLVVGRTYTFGVKDANGCEAAYTGDIYASVSSPAISAMLEAIQLVTEPMVMQRLKYVVAMRITQAHQLISVGQCMTKQPMR